MLLGRSAAQAALKELLADAGGGRSGALVLRGEAGIGKSALLDWTAGEAAGLGLPVLRVTGAEREAELGFAGLVQLLWPVRDRIGALPEPQRAALRAVLDAGQDRGPDRFLTGLAVLTLLAGLAERGPLLCLVDDAQWVDRSSAEALLFAARRLAAEGVAMVFAVRDEGLDGHGLTELPLPRLGARDAADLLADRGFTAELRDRIVAESAGNPLALLEFAAAAGSWPGAAPGEREPLPVADRVLAGFRAQLDGLPERARLMAVLAAAEARGDLPLLLRAAAALGTGLDELEGSRLLHTTGTAVAFRHPLIATAAYRGAPLAARSAAHRALAEAADDPDCRAHHLAAATTAPDAGAAAEIAAAAERARRRTAYAAAAGRFRRAAQLAPDRGDQAAWLVAAVSAAASAGRLEWAAELAEEAEPRAGVGALRAELAQVRSVVEFELGAPGRAAGLLVRGASHAAPDDAAAMLRTAAGFGWFAGSPEPVGVAARRLRELGRPDEAAEATAYLLHEDYARGLPLLAGYVARVRRASRESAYGTPADTPAGTAEGVRRVGGDERMQALYGSIILGDDEAALDLAADEVERCRAEGLIGRLPKVLQAQAMAERTAGRHRAAAASVAEAAAIARDTGLHRRTEELDVVRAWLAAAEGDEARCTELAGRASDTGRVAADCALSMLDLSRGRHAAALDRLETAWRGPGRHATVLLAATGDLVEAAVRLGRPERAHAPLDRFRRWADAGGRPWALAVAARCAALLGGGEEAYLRALRLHERGGRPFERARTELLYGEWLRRERRRSEAREPLRAALECFERLDAAPWAARARAELRATGTAVSAGPPAARARPADRLTPQELQVARLAAQGLSSRQIGARLFLSPRTVEHHLYKAYPKLGVASRAELARVELAGPGDG
ncbi:helix-turn-helix transcriptional regulator [Streptomyces sp. WAC 06738]|uniref:LuxR C-terminal-related transcriptional regulator n=1 Tax=Streptomyces sp. WAC 06738 TaxID=2203210 RepID=UPI000F6E6DB1|nr:LuxR family transcriptional regulator [Streptomyces sp. WAC 06738]AZM50315.1 helix-turn-helix transcriptional regulator [Streptomyces sp. WAC 06738]